MLKNSMIKNIMYIISGIITMILFFGLGMIYNAQQDPIYADDEELNLINTTETTNITSSVLVSSSQTTTVTTAEEIVTYTIPTIYDVTLEEAERGDIETKQKYIWDFFVSRGYNEVATSAIIGNMMCEDPTLTGNNDSKSYNDSSSYTDGIIQWDPFDKHMNWANAEGYDWYDLEGQLTHVDEMLQGSGWMQSRLDGISGTYNNCIEIHSITCEEFPTCNNVAVATVAFERGIEGSHDWSNDQDTKRINTAYAVYDKLH